MTQFDYVHTYTEEKNVGYACYEVLKTILSRQFRYRESQSNPFQFWNWSFHWVPRLLWTKSKSELHVRRQKFVEKNCRKSFEKRCHSKFHLVLGQLLAFTMFHWSLGRSTHSTISQKFNSNFKLLIFETYSKSTLIFSNKKIDNKSIRKELDYVWVEQTPLVLV